MDLTALGKELEGEFVDSRDVAGLGEVWLPGAPVDLGIVVMDVFDGEFTDGGEAFKAFLRGGHLQTLISFTWEEDGADSFESSLEILTIGERSFLTISPDEPSDQEWEAFVAVDDATPDAWEALIVDLCRENGNDYAMELFSSLPTRVDTVAVAPRFVLQSFYSYLDWDEARSPGAWLASAEYLPGPLANNVSVGEAAKRLVGEDTKQHRFSYVSTYVAAVYNDPSQELAAVAAS